MQTEYSEMDSFNQAVRRGTSAKPQSDQSKRECGNEGIWSLSSSKIGNGIEQLRDENLSTFWQSDDTQPHFILIQFLRKIRINEIWIYLDYKTDESYTPSKIAIQIENSFNEIVDIKEVDFEEPNGWFQIKLEEKNANGIVVKPYIKTMTLKIVILQNIHNGRDTHIRNVKIFSPREHRSFDLSEPNFLNPEYTQFTEIR